MDIRFKGCFPFQRVFFVLHRFFVVTHWFVAGAHWVVGASTSASAGALNLSGCLKLGRARVLALQSHSAVDGHVVHDLNWLDKESLRLADAVVCCERERSEETF